MTRLHVPFILAVINTIVTRYKVKLRLKPFKLLTNFYLILTLYRYSKLQCYFRITFFLLFYFIIIIKKVLSVGTKYQSRISWPFSTWTNLNWTIISPFRQWSVTRVSIVKYGFCCYFNSISSRFIKPAFVCCFPYKRLNVIHMNTQGFIFFRFWITFVTNETHITTKYGPVYPIPRLNPAVGG